MGQCGSSDLLVYWKHDGQHMGEIGSIVQKISAFVEGFTDKLILFVIEFHDGFLKVPNASMNKFGCF
jgi:hypothetical protein